MSRGIPGPSKPIAPQIDDQAVGRAIAGHARALDDLQNSPLGGARVVADVVLADATPTTVIHNLGHTPSWVRASCPRATISGALTAGEVREIRTSGTDRRTAIVLQADGYGASITVDVMVL